MRTHRHLTGKNQTIRFSGQSVRCALTMLLWLLCVVLISTVGVGQQPPSKEPQDKRATQDPSTQQSQTKQADRVQSESETGDDGWPSLGVWVTPSPGTGVHVVASIWGSPAQEAGIQPGDYIMSINGTEVSTPTELQATVRKLEPGATATVRVWRNEQVMEKSVKLARQADQMPESHRTWLGIVLTPTQGNGEEGAQQGVKVARVFPNSPADEAGLRAGDIITKTGDQPTVSIESLLECMEKHAPGDGCKVTIQRDGETKSINLKMGDVNSAPTDWLLDAFRAPLDAFDLGQDESQSGGELRQMVEQLRREITDLRNRVEVMERGSGTSPTNRSDSPRNTNPDQNESSEREPLPLDPGAAISPIALTTAALWPSTPTVQDRGRRGGSRVYYNYNYPYQTHYYRYGYPAYYWGYQPSYNTWYYDYNGNRWYYQGYNRGPYYYGPRYGVRVGPSWGVYWY